MLAALLALSSGRSLQQSMAVHSGLAGLCASPVRLHWLPPLKPLSHLKLQEAEAATPLALRQVP